MALREFSRKLRISERGSNINLQYSFENTVRRLEISAEASTLLQRRILLPETRNIQLRASGGGVGLVQIGYDFNVAVNGAWPSFVVNPLVFKATEPNQLKVSVCTNYIQEGSGSTSNMAVMEVTLPSGFTIDKDSLPALRRYKGVKRVDSMSGDTKVIFLSASSSCSHFYIFVLKHLSPIGLGISRTISISWEREFPKYYGHSREIQICYVINQKHPIFDRKCIYLANFNDFQLGYLGYHLFRQQSLIQNIQNLVISRNF